MNLNDDLDFLTTDVGSVVRGRELTTADVKKAATEPKGRIGRLRERHHALAREVAAGTKTDKQIAIEHGYTPATVSRLRSDATFMELVDHYARGFEANAADLLDKLKELSYEATEEIRERLETEPDKFSLGQLMELTKLTADRTGHGPSLTSTNVNVNIGMGDRLSSAAKRMKTIEGQVEPKLKELDL